MALTINLKQDHKVGIGEIDEHHRLIVEHMSNLQCQVVQGEEISAIEVAYAELVSATQIHFAVEETLMRIYGYPCLQEHVEQHRKFLAILDALHLRLATAHTTDDFTQSLIEWLAAHITTQDKPYALHFLNHPRKDRG